MILHRLLVLCLTCLAAGFLTGEELPHPRTLRNATAEPFAIETPHLRRQLPIAPGHRLIVTRCYTLSLNPETKLADWCAFVVTPAGFETNNVLKREWQTVHEAEALEAEDYAGSAYDRGHLCPLGSFHALSYAHETNRLENIIPQRPRLNVGVWRVLEERVRSLSRNGPVHVVCGPLFTLPREPLPMADEPHQVPSHCWQRIEQGDLVEAYLFPQEVPLGAKLPDYAVPPSLLELETGLPLSAPVPSLP